jgi:adenine-specific DNA-methyltransferase
VSFYGWGASDLFMQAWKESGLRPVGHIVFCKPYASSERFLGYQHECAYLLAKGNPPLSASPLPDVLDFPYTGNRLHPTQKPLKPLMELTLRSPPPAPSSSIRSRGPAQPWSPRTSLKRRFIGIDLDEARCRTARHRLSRLMEPVLAATA